MLNRKTIVNASNIHSGGGSVLLEDFIRSASEFDQKFLFLVDERFKFEKFKSKNLTFFPIKVKDRLKAHKLIEKNCNANDAILYLGNIPPFKKHSVHTSLYLQNRMLLEKISLSGYPLKLRIRLAIEKLIFFIGLNNADCIIVQNHSMLDLLKKFPRKYIGKIYVWPFKGMEEVSRLSIVIDEKEPDSFIYIAGPDPHKNHRKLLEAWKLLKKENIEPLLKLTIDDDFFKKECHFLMDFINNNQLNVKVIPHLDRQDIFKEIKNSSALIYPSTFESFGLPLVEASMVEVPIIASELDFVRDILDPSESFDPNSSKSISRAVKRFLVLDDKKAEILDPKKFLENITCVK